MVKTSNSFEQLRVLVADDMPAMRMILRDMLEQMGIVNIEEAEDGEMAWEIVQAGVLSDDRASRVDLIIADWNMPIMSGADLLRSVRGFAATRDLPVLICTSNSAARFISEAVAHQVSDYVVKPFSLEDLKAKITQILKTEIALG
jgi:two-component system chemotaxis response regulator CheY